MQTSYSIHTLYFKNTFTISHSDAKDVKKTLILKLSLNGLEGLGECIESDYWGFSVESHILALAEIQYFIETISSIPYPPDVWPELYNRLKHNMFLLCAIDVALWDLWAKSKSAPIYKVLNLEPKDACISSFTIGIDSPQKMLEKLAEEPGWPIYKIKLSQETNNLEILEHFGAKEPYAKFIVDANCAWTAEYTIRNIPFFRKFKVCLIEQPLKRGLNKESKQIISRSSLPIFADESCMTESDIDDCIGNFSGINIKLMKCGGITPALRMIKKARESGMQIMLGCMGGETTVGISAAAQLLPLIDIADIDGSNLIVNNPAQGGYLEKGTWHYVDTPGLGVSLKDHKEALSV